MSQCYFREQKRGEERKSLRRIFTVQTITFLYTSTVISSAVCQMSY